MCTLAFNSEQQQQTCKDILENTLSNNENSEYSPFKGKTLSFNREKCKAHFDCLSINAVFKPSNCTFVNESTKTATTYVDEYKYFISIFN